MCYNWPLLNNAGSQFLSRPHGNEIILLLFKMVYKIKIYSKKSSYTITKEHENLKKPNNCQYCKLVKLLFYNNKKSLILFASRKLQDLCINGERFNTFFSLAFQAGLVTLQISKMDH